MKIVLDIETIPCADKQRFLDAAVADFKAPSTLTKAEAGADLGMSADAIKYIGAKDLIAKWESEMAATKAPEVAELAWRKTSLDGTYGRVFSIAWKFADESQGGHFIHDGNDEVLLLKDFFSHVQRQLDKATHGRPPFFIGHNLEWDLKFLFRRCIILGIQPVFELPFKGRHDKDYFCTMQGWCAHGERISLANLCTALNIPAKTEMDGSMVCDYWLAGRFDEISQYNKEDVDVTLAAYKRLTWSQS